MSNWKEKTLSEYCEFQEGYVNPPKGHSEYFGGDIKWCRAVDINNGYVYSTSQTLTDAGFNSAKKSAVLFKPNTIVITKSGTIGRLGIIKDYMCGNRATINIIPKNNADVEFVFYLLRSRQNEFFDLAVGSVQKNLYVSILEKMMFKFPSLYEQKKIASFFSVIDKKIDINNRINRNLSEQAQAIYESWFVSFEKFGGMVPLDWGEGVLGDIAEIKTTTFKPDKEPDVIVEHYSIPALDENHFPIFELAEGIKSNKYLLNKNSVMISKLNPDIKRIWRPMCLSDRPVCSTEFIVFEAKNKKNKDFIFSILDSDNFNNHLCSHVTGSTGSRQRAVPKATLDFKVLIPPSEVIEQFCSMVTPIYDLIGVNEIENQRLSELRDSLLPKLMSGELDVSDLNI